MRFGPRLAASTSSRTDGRSRSRSQPGSTATRGRSRRALLLCVLVATAVVGNLASSASDPSPGPQPASHPSTQPGPFLDSAFLNRFHVDTIANIDLVMRDRTGQELRRKLIGYSKVIDGRVHSLGQITWPERLRGMTVLTIEASDRSQDAFVYLPALKRVRRISTAQRGEAFFGTDVTYEDLEPRRVDDYEILAVEAGERQGEPVLLITTRPLLDSQYDTVRFGVASADGSILEIDYFKEGREGPYRSITSYRSSMIERNGHVLPTRLRVVNHARERVTEVTYNDLQVDPVIDDKLFTVVRLERERDLPDIEAPEPAPASTPTPSAPSP